MPTLRSSQAHREKARPRTGREPGSKVEVLGCLQDNRAVGNSRLAHRESRACPEGSLALPLYGTIPQAFYTSSIDGSTLREGETVNRSRGWPGPSLECALKTAKHFRLTAPTCSTSGFYTSTCNTRRISQQASFSRTAAALLSSSSAPPSIGSLGAVLAAAGAGSLAGITLAVQA